MIDGTWTLLEWSAFFVLMISIGFTAVTIHTLLLDKGHRVLAALMLVATIYVGTFALLIFGNGF